MGNWELEVDGVWKDFEDDYGLKIKSWPGTGHSPVINRSTDYALQDGALFTGQKMGVRAFTLISAFYGSATLAAFHDQRQALIKALSSRTTKINTKPATVKLKYTGGTADKEIDVIYEGGLDLATFTPTFIENDVPVRFSAYNPQFNATSDTVQALDTEDIITTLEGTFGKIDGVWGNIDGGTNAVTFAQTFDSNGNLYVTGNFTTAGGVSCAKIAKWDGIDWTPLGSGLFGTGYCITTDSIGNVYVGGSFTTAGGGAALRVAKWDGATWSAFGGGVDNGIVYAIHVDIDGNVYIGGSFTATAGGATAYLSKWTGAAWAAVGTAPNGTIRVIKSDIDGNIFVGGSFTTAGGGVALRVAKWDGATWSAFGDGLSATVYDLYIERTGTVYAAGGFELMGSVGPKVLRRVAYWDGSTWNEFAGGIDNGSVRTISKDDYGNWYAGGDITRGILRVNRGVWDSTDINLGSTVHNIAFLDSDIYCVYQIAASDTLPGSTTIAYAGTEIAYPSISILRTGGTSASIVAITNAETSAELLFDYNLLDGETLTIDLRPGQRVCTSSYYGSRWDAIIDNSNISDFFLQPGNASTTNDNIITALIDTVGSPTITTNLTYRTAYRSLD